MTIKELRRFTDLNQENFASRFHIPLQTLKQWESSPTSKSYRKPPEYVNFMLEQLIMDEIARSMLREFEKLEREKTRQKELQSMIVDEEKVWG